MELYKKCKSKPAWVNFENRTGRKNEGGKENQGAKGHAMEPLQKGEQKVLCDLDGSGVIRRIWMTLDDRSCSVLQNVRLLIYWDHAASPSVDVPIGDFFCLGHGEMVKFENEFFSSPEGRSFNCFVPMPFRKNAKIIIANNSDHDINHLFYDINLTLEEIDADNLYFHALFQDIAENPLEMDIATLPKTTGEGRFLGQSIRIKANTDLYDLSWWGEGEVKIYLDDDEFASLVGTGAEDYVGSAWSLGAFCHRSQGCLCLKHDLATFYRFHTVDPIYFSKNCRVTMQVLGGDKKETVKHHVDLGKPLIVISADVNGKLLPLYRKDFSWQDLPDDAWLNFYRQDAFRTVAYYYLDRPD